MRNLYLELLLGRPLGRGLQLQFVIGFKESATQVRTTTLQFCSIKLKNRSIVGHLSSVGRAAPS